MMEEQDIRAKASTLRAALAQRGAELAAMHEIIAEERELSGELRAELAVKDSLIHQLGENAAKAAGEYAEEVGRLRLEKQEAMRRRDEWRKKAEGFDTIRRALREKIGDPPPPQMSRFLWAAVAADEKKRANDAEAYVVRLRGFLCATINAQPNLTAKWFEDARDLLARAALTEPTDG